MLSCMHQQGRNSICITMLYIENQWNGNQGLTGLFKNQSTAEWSCKKKKKFQ